MDRWYFMEGQERVGPLSVEQVVEAMRSGRLNGQTLVGREGVTDWKPAESVPEFAVRVPEQPLATTDAPPLWNPNAAANWSLILSPAFGAIVHAYNWRSLGQDARASKSLIWAYVTIGVYAFHMVGVFVEESSLSLALNAVGKSLFYVVPIFLGLCICKCVDLSTSKNSKSSFIGDVWTYIGIAVGSGFLIAYLLINLVEFEFESVPAMNRLTRILVFLILLAWYFTSAKPQASYVKQRFGANYPRKSWGMPLVIGFTLVVALSLAISLLTP